MRTPIAILAGTLMLAACGPTTRVVYVPAPATTPAPAQPPARVIPAPAPAPMPPVGVTIVRVDDSRLLVSTNQPAYVAVFEIVPNRGVTLVYPASRAQRQVAMAGSNWLTVAWRSARGLTDDVRDARGRRQRAVAHHVYALASERPLRLTDKAFDDAALGAMLGARLTAAADPYETMAALSRRFVPPGSDEDWGEDVYTMDVLQPAPTRVAKVYCPDGSVVYVRDELTDRAACPWRGQGRGNAPMPRPDSVVASNGRPVPRPVSPEPARVFRIPAPVGTPATPPVNGGDVATGRPGNGTDALPPGRDKPKDNNGNHYGWGNGNGNSGNNGNASSGNNGNNGNNGNANNGNNGNNGNGNDDKDKSNNGNHYGQEKGNNGNGANGNGSNNGRQGQDATIQQQGKPADRPASPPPAEPKPVEVKPEPAPAAPPAAPPAARAEPPKEEPRGMLGVGKMLQRKAAADSAEKAKKDKPEHD